MKRIKAILIDSYNKRVLEVEYEAESLDGMYRLLKCTRFTTAGQLPNGDVCFVDDEGLINGTEVFFVPEWYPQPLAGNGLIVGDDGKGESFDVKSTVEEIQAMVDFKGIDDILFEYSK